MTEASPPALSQTMSLAYQFAVGQPIRHQIVTHTATSPADGAPTFFSLTLIQSQVAKEADSDSFTVAIALEVVETNGPGASQTPASSTVRVFRNGFTTDSEGLQLAQATFPLDPVMPGQGWSVAQGLTTQYYFESYDSGVATIVSQASDLQEVQGGKVSLDVACKMRFSVSQGRLLKSYTRSVQSFDNGLSIEVVTDVTLLDEQ